MLGFFKRLLFGEPVVDPVALEASITEDIYVLGLDETLRKMGATECAVCGAIGWIEARNAHWSW